MIRYQQDIQSCIVYDDGASAWKVFTPDDAPYDLDGTNIMSTTPTYHFDAALVNGVDATGNPSNAAALTGTWSSRTNDFITTPIATGTQQPTYYTSGTNSKPYFSFDGGDYVPIIPFYDGFEIASGPFTIFAVAEKGADASGYLSFTGNVGGSNKTLHMNYSNGTDYLFFSSTGASNGKARPNIDGSLATYATTRMFLITRDSLDNGDLFLDGNNQTTALASTYSGSIVGNYGGTAGSPFASNGGNGIGKSSYATTGHIYEVALFGSDLSTADRNKLITYVNTKYGTGRNADDSGTFARVAFS